MPSGKWNSKSGDASADALPPHTVAAINALPAADKLLLYTRLIPAELLQAFKIAPDFKTAAGEDLLYLNCTNGGTVAEMALYHQPGAIDPILYGQISDSFTGHLHVLLYVLNDPTSPRFDVDQLPDGTATNLGVDGRNLPAETAALAYGLAPGQVRRGLRLLAPAVTAFEHFVSSLGQNMYYAEPLYYHNAIIFERYGFSYQMGRKLMDRIQAGFAPDGDLHAALDGSTPFRQPEAADSIRLRSWAIHDGLLGEPFRNITMYKLVGETAPRSDSCPGCGW